MLVNRFYYNVNIQRFNMVANLDWYQPSPLSVVWGSQYRLKPLHENGAKKVLFSQTVNLSGCLKLCWPLKILKLK